jgi:hypothetical protein
MTDTTPSFEGTSPRDVLAAALQAQFPDWLVISSERAPGTTIDRPAIVLKQRTIAPLDAAPQSYYTVSYYVTVVADEDDFDLAEVSLDANVLAVWECLMSLSSVHPVKADKATFNNSYLSYDIETDLTVQKG